MSPALAGTRRITLDVDDPSALTFCLRRHGKMIRNRSIGYARGLAPQAPLSCKARRAEPDTPACIFSASKAGIAALTHKLAAEGGIDLDAPMTTGKAILGGHWVQYMQRLGTRNHRCREGQP